MQIKSDLFIFISATMVTVLGSLITALWFSLIRRSERMEDQINERLRTLGHEDRDIRAQIHSMLQIMTESNRETMDHISKSMDLMSSVFARYGPIGRADITASKRDE